MAAVRAPRDGFELDLCSAEPFLLAWLGKCMDENLIWKRACSWSRQATSTRPEPFARQSAHASPD
eukprot:2249301-Pyramimonas_sp.AAC.1